MGVCKKILRTDLKWYQMLWNIIIGKKEKNYAYVESREDERKSEK